MSKDITSIVEEAERLPAADRIRLVEQLLDGLDKPDPGIDKIWAEEGEQRLDDYMRGETPARQAADVLGKHLKP